MKKRPANHRCRLISFILVLVLAALFIFGCAAAEGNTAAEEGVTGTRALSTDHLVLFWGDIVLFKDIFDTEIALAVLEDGSPVKGVLWMSSNPSLIDVDKNGVITVNRYGTATITGIVDGVSYPCLVEVHEIRMYSYWEYSGDPDANLWVWDKAICMSVGQTVKFKLEEWVYDTEGKVSQITDITEKYPLTAKAPDYVDMKVGSVTALKPGSSQDDYTSVTYYDLVNPAIGPKMMIYLNVFTDTVENCADQLVIRCDESIGYCYLDSDYKSATFTLDDSMAILSTDWCLSRCLPEEFEWISSDTSILEFTGPVRGCLRPNALPDSLRPYSVIPFKVNESGKVTLSVLHNGNPLVSTEVTVTKPEPVIYNVLVNTDGNGTGYADPSSGPEGTEVTLVAQPSSGYQFKQWDVWAGGIEIKDNKFIIGNSDVQVYAVFEPIEEPEPDLIDITGAKITKIRDQVYTGKKVTPKVTVNLSGKTLKEGTDFEVAWKNNKAVGTATVTFTGMGGYTGQVKVTFTINPKPTALSSLTSGVKKLKVKWKKGSGITGYEIQYSLKKSFKGSQTLTIPKAKTASTVLQDLKAGKTYYVRIRTYKTVKGKKYFSSWSAAVKAKVEE